jgi:hypothetical protein
MIIRTDFVLKWETPCNMTFAFDGASRTGQRIGRIPPNFYLHNISKCVQVYSVSLQVRLRRYPLPAVDERFLMKMAKQALRTGNAPLISNPFPFTVEQVRVSAAAIRPIVDCP